MKLLLVHQNFPDNLGPGPARDRGIKSRLLAAVSGPPILELKYSATTTISGNVQGCIPTALKSMNGSAGVKR